MTDAAGPITFTDNPLNPLEELLYTGLADPTQMGAFERIMLEADLYAVPEADGPGGPPGDDGAKVLRPGEQLILRGVVLNDGRNTVTLFTDPTRVVQMYGEDTRILAMQGRKLLEMVAPDERIVTIEDSLELLPGQPNTVSLIAQRDEASPRSADKLLQATLRLRPDRIILGELRGSEAATFLDAINTGHSGSFTTLHAHSARKAMDRLALLVMAQGTKLSFAEVIRYLETSIDVILQMGRQGDRRGIMEMYFPGLED